MSIRLYKTPESLLNDKKLTADAREEKKLQYKAIIKAIRTSLDEGRRTNGDVARTIARMCPNIDKKFFTEVLEHIGFEKNIAHHMWKTYKIPPHPVKNKEEV